MLVVIVVGVGAGCPPAPTLPPDVVEVCGCASDRECPGPFICDKVNDDDDIPPRDDACGVCVELPGPCECNGEVVPCDLRRICEPPAACDPRDPAACAGEEVCLVDDGLVACREPRPTDRCETVLNQKVARAGDVVTASAIAFDVDGALVPAGPRAVIADCAVDVCAQVVAVDVDGVSCAPVTLPVHAVVTRGHRVVVGHEGGPLAGARVRWFSDGALLAEGVSDANGAAVVDADIVDEVRVDGDGFESHSVVDPPRDLLLVSRRLPGQVVAVAGSVDDSALHARGDVLVAFVGLPLSRDAGHFTAVDLTGAAVDTVVAIDGVEGPALRPVGAGVVAVLGDTAFKSRWLATTPARSGRLLVWSLATRVRLSTAGPMLGEHGATFDLRFAGFPADHGLAVVDAGAAVDIPVVVDVDENGVADRLVETGAVAITARPDTILPLAAAFDVDGAPFRAASSTAVTGIGLVGAVVPGAGVVPLGIKAFSADDVEGDALFVDYTPQRGLEQDPIELWTFTWPTPPVRDTDTVAFRRGERWAPLPVASVDETSVVVDVVVGIDITHVRVVCRDGRIWNLWTPRPLVAGEVEIEVETGAIEAAAASAIDLEDGADLAIATDGGASHVDAFTRVACVAGICR